MMQEETFYGKYVNIYHSNSSPGGSPTDNVTVTHLNDNSTPSYGIRLSVNGTTIAESGSLNNNTFHDIQVTHDGNGNWELFVNGSSQGTGSASLSADCQLFYLRYDRNGRFDDLVID